MGQSSLSFFHAILYELQQGFVFAKGKNMLALVRLIKW
jgi:hypothetical protein